LTDQELAPHVNKLFDNYTKVFDAVDSAGIAACYHTPSISMRGDASVHVFGTRQELEEFFQDVAQKYRDSGLAKSRFAVLSIEPIGSKSALVTVQWTHLRSDGSTIRAWKQSYNLICLDGRWLILVSSFHI
jgi:hypothetical protein